MSSLDNINYFSDEPRQLPHWDELPEDSRERWDKLLKLIDLPPLVFETMAVNMQGEQAEAQFLARRVGTDPLLAAKVLAVANSATAGLNKSVTSLERAIIHLGLNMLHYIVLAYYIETIVKARVGFSRDHMEYVQRWGAISSLLAGKIAIAAKYPDVPVITTAALLSRLGGLVLGLEPPVAGPEYWSMPDEVRRLIYEFERWQVGCHIVSARLIENWGLPEPLPRLASTSTDALFWRDDVPPGQEGKAQAIIAASIVLAAANLGNPATAALQVFGREAYANFKTTLKTLNLYDIVIKTYSQAAVIRDMELIRR